jgi:hypothetical protein
MSKISNKLALGKLYGKEQIKKLALEGKGKSVFLARVVGLASKIDTGESNYGEWKALLGEFILQDNKGEDHISGKLFLPDVAMNLVIGSMSNPEEKVEVGFDIFVCQADSPVGYEYQAQFVVEPKTTNPVFSLLDKANKENPLQLENKSKANKENPLQLENKSKAA